jgi:hypothetical protein
MLQNFSEWLTQTPLHDFLSDTTRMSTWLIVPVSQTIHILAVSVLMICVGLLNLRALSIAGRRESFGKLAGDVMPYVWAALGVLLFTGTVQTIAEPTRELLSAAFATNMALLIAVVSIAAVFQTTTKKDANYWDRSVERQWMVSVLGLVSLFLWLGIAAAGRLIAYVT